ncbi:hypothetical protein DFH06DRAFT_1225071 [Mycena polygramma]|nr:hypothetical protein DFH06DRAFT_1225071 [Mycena polygramma]
MLSLAQVVCLLEVGLSESLSPSLTCPQMCARAGRGSLGRHSTQVSSALPRRPRALTNAWNSACISREQRAVYLFR